MKFVNLTNRNITIVDANGNVRLQIPPSGKVVGVEINSEVLCNYFSEDQSEHDGPIECVTYHYENISGMPEPLLGVMYVVGFSVLQALDGEREDVCSPDTSPQSVVRLDNPRRVLGVTKLRKL